MPLLKIGLIANEFIPAESASFFKSSSSYEVRQHMKGYVKLGAVSFKNFLIF